MTENLASGTGALWANSATDAEPCAGAMLHISMHAGLVWTNGIMPQLRGKISSEHHPILEGISGSHESILGAPFTFMVRCSLGLCRS